MDTIIGKEQKGVILTLVERVTGFTIIRLLEHGKDRIFHSKLHFGVENTEDLHVQTIWFIAFARGIMPPLQTFRIYPLGLFYCSKTNSEVLFELI